jgi:hypothetical protein
MKMTGHHRMSRKNHLSYVRRKKDWIQMACCHRMKVWRQMACCYRKMRVLRLAKTLVSKPAVL